ncbi:MAG: M23 family metallopeptidase [Clostridia bacterium]|nr:M23 family metallopeptidase [Clostridia bacterium]
MSRLNRFLNGKGFYVALGICMIAIGVSAWSALDKVSTPPSSITSDSTAQTVEDTSSKEAEANKEQSDIPDDRVSSSTSSEEILDKVSSKEAEILEPPTAKYFIFPVVGEVIKKFSATELQYSVTFNDMRLHSGIDIKADEGTAVKSAGDGKVTEIINDPQLGFLVRIDHGNGMEAVYAGLNKSVAVEENEIVKSGTNLGPLGTVNNECLDAPHLHLEFYKNGEPVDPLEYLEK